MSVTSCNAHVDTIFSFKRREKSLLNQNRSVHTYQAFKSATPVRNWCGNQNISELPTDERYWSLDLCIKEAARFSSRQEWEQKSPISYKKAIKRGWLTKCTVHIANFKRKPTVPEVWTYEICRNLAKKCTTRTQFKKMFSYPYEKCRKNGWLDMCCSHMV